MDDVESTRDKHPTSSQILVGLFTRMAPPSSQLHTHLLPKKTLAHHTCAYLAPEAIDSGRESLQGARWCQEHTILYSVMYNEGFET